MSSKQHNEVSQSLAHHTHSLNARTDMLQSDLFALDMLKFPTSAKVAATSATTTTATDKRTQLVQELDILHNQLAQQYETQLLLRLVPQRNVSTDKG